MRMTFTIWLLLLSGWVLAQNRPADFSYIDRRIQSVSHNDPRTLSQQLTAPYQAEKEKVRAIFRWITEHIAYHRQPPPSRRKQKKIPGYDLAEQEDTAALPALTERMAIKVLQDRKAVCEGYARLFKSLCDHAGIRSEIITGFARNEPSVVQSRFRSNHSWNAVNIDGRWQLLDVTWASGVIIFPTGEFLKYYDDYYFLTPPDQFIKHHYPDDLRWTLLDEPPLISEFRYSPFRQRSFVKYPILRFSPAAGIIDAAVGDSIRLEVFTDPAARNWPIASDSMWESVDTLNPVYAFVKPLSDVPAAKLEYVFPVTSTSTQWLHLMYNNDAILRYRLNIRKELARTRHD